MQEGGQGKTLGGRRRKDSGLRGSCIERDVEDINIGCSLGYDQQHVRVSISKCD